MEIFKSDNTLPYSRIYNAVSPVDRMSRLSLLVTYGVKDHSYLLSQVVCDNYQFFSPNTITALIKWAARDIHRIDPLATGIYVCPHTNDTTVQLDNGAPYYAIDILGLIPTDKYEIGSNRRWYYWPIDAN